MTLAPEIPMKSFQPLNALILVLAATLVSACQRAEAPPEIRPVRTLLVGTGNTEQIMTFTGEIHSRYETDLAFQVGGKIVQRAVDVGAMVKQGAILARLDTQDLQLAVDTSQSAVAAAQAQLDRARSDEIRYRDLLERGLTTRSTFLAQQTNAKTAQSQLEQAKSELQLRRQQLGYASLRADRDAVVTKAYQNAGAVVAAGQPVLELAQRGELEAVFDAAENQVDQVRAAAGGDVRLLNSDAASIKGRIREVSPSADPATRTYRVRMSLGEPSDLLKLGMLVSVAIRPASSDARALSVPATALYQQNAKPAVWIVRSDSTLELRPVMVRRYDSDRVQLASGVKPGERIVTAGVHKLSAGARVRLLEAL
jgi:membrane fusion protein, multidrug efflux system